MQKEKKTKRTQTKADCQSWKQHTFVFLPLRRIPSFSERPNSKHPNQKV